MTQPINLSDKFSESQYKHPRNTTFSEFLNINPEAAGSLEAVEVPFDNRDIALLRSKIRPELAILCHNLRRERAPNPIKFDFPQLRKYRFDILCNCCDGSRLIPESQRRGAGRAAVKQITNIKKSYTFPKPIDEFDNKPRILNEIINKYPQVVSVLVEQEESALQFNLNLENAQRRLNLLSRQIEDSILQNNYYVYLKQLEDFLRQNGINSIFINCLNEDSLLLKPEMSNITIYDIYDLKGDHRLDNKIDAKLLEQSLINFSPNI